MTEVLVRKELGGLRPASDEAFKVLSKIKAGTVLVADVRDPRRRSNARHSYWFAIVTMLYENQELYRDFDDFRRCLLIRLGRCTYYPQRNGEPIPQAKSVSFAKMTEEEFGRLVDDTLEFANELGFERATLEAEARAFVGESTKGAA